MPAHRKHSRWAILSICPLDEWFRPYDLKNPSILSHSSCGTVLRAMHDDGILLRRRTDLAWEYRVNMESSIVRRWMSQNGLSPTTAQRVDIRCVETVSEEMTI